VYFVNLYFKEYLTKKNIIALKSSRDQLQKYTIKKWGFLLKKFKMVMLDNNYYANNVHLMYNLRITLQ